MLILTAASFASLSHLASLPPLTSADRHALADNYSHVDYATITEVIENPLDCPTVEDLMTDWAEWLLEA